MQEQETEQTPLASPLTGGSSKFSFTLEKTDGAARAGEIITPHGKIRTPIFMPVGTRSALKGLTTDQVREIGAEIVLVNNYHSYLRPGTEVIESFGGLHEFMNVDFPILTDSGGFQVFSLGLGMSQTNTDTNTNTKVNGNVSRTKKDSNVSIPLGGRPERSEVVQSWTQGGLASGNGELSPPTPPLRGAQKSEPLAKITEEGVHFRSYLDGSKHFFNPENVMDMQSAFGADIIMAFDECAPGGSTREYARAAMERTHRWAVRSKEQWLKNEEIRAGKGLYPQALFGIIQGVVYDDLRAESAEFIKNLDLPGIAIGGLSVGESKRDMYRIMDVLEPILPREKPHYLMGVGTPEDIVEGIARGIDMFDCVLATRIGRHGEAFSSYGNIKIGGEKYKFSQEHIPMLPEHETMVSREYSLGYLRHLVNVGEATGGVLLSLHNIEYLLKLTKTARQAILDGRFEEFRERFWSVYPVQGS